MKGINGATHFRVRIWTNEPAQKDPSISADFAFFPDAERFYLASLEMKNLIKAEMFCVASTYASHTAERYI